MEAGYEAFDLKRMFLGDTSTLFLAEIAVRTLIMYTFALFAVRFIGKRGIGSLSPFEYVFVFALGSATGDPMLHPDVPLVYGMVVITGLVLFQKLLLRSTQRNDRAEQFLEGRPTLIIDGGKMDDVILRQEDLSRGEVLMKLRTQGIANVGQVRYAYLEPSGELSVFKYESTFTPGQSTLVVGD
jgi:uncharacterized membrane protein YcaP (DUF421 family)